jgi:purine-binding chemotaxis protein CheW
MTELQQYCTFWIQGSLYGVEVEQVQEVIRHQGMTLVPLAPQAVAGLINLRGQIVTAIDLRRRLGVAERAAEELPMNVVVRTGEGAVSLLVDEIDDVIEVERPEMQPPPGSLDEASSLLLRGVYKLKHQLLLVLNTDVAVDIAVTEPDGESNEARSTAAYA